MIINSDVLADAVYDNIDAAIDSGWTPYHWEYAGLVGFMRRNLKKVEDIRLLAARLGSSNLLHLVRNTDNKEDVIITDNPVFKELKFEFSCQCCYQEPCMCWTIYGDLS